MRLKALSLRNQSIGWMLFLFGEIFVGVRGKKDDVSQENRLPLKRKSEEETNIATKRQKTEQV